MQDLLTLKGFRPIHFALFLFICKRFRPRSLHLQKPWRHRLVQFHGGRGTGRLTVGGFAYYQQALC